MTKWLRLIRIQNLVIIALLQYFLRYWLIIPILNSYGIEPVLSDFRFALLMISTICLAASGYVINDYFDIRIDKINRPLKVVVGISLSRRKALMLHIILTSVGLLLGYFLAYVTRKENYMVMFTLIPILLWVYTTTLKKQVLIGNLAISALTALVAYVVVSIEFAALARRLGESIFESPACDKAWFWTTGFAFFAFMSNLMREIIKDVEDMKGDQINGCRTLPIALGLKYTRTIIILMAGFSIAALWILYFSVPQLSQSNLTTAYFALAITLPYLLLSLFIRKAKNPAQFHTASLLSKAIMLSGILYLLVAGSFFN